MLPVFQENVLSHRPPKHKLAPCRHLGPFLRTIDLKGYNEKTVQPARLYGFSNRFDSFGKRLALRELEPATGTRLTGLLAFLDAGVKVQVSGIDGTHMDEIAHFTMATAVMSRIRQLFQPEKEKR